MSGKAILRRQCKRAMRQLIARFGYKADSFEIPDTRDNSLDVLPGTPICWRLLNSEDDEYECDTAVDELRMAVSRSDVDWSKMARQDWLRERWAAMRAHPERFLSGANTEGATK